MNAWETYRRHLCVCEPVQLSLDISRMNPDPAFLESMEPAMQRAFDAMEALESGAVANPDEKRQVGHYWLRAPHLAPDPAIGRAITETLGRLLKFTAEIHAGQVKPEKSPRFTQVLVIGIGGSALGPQFVADALGDPATDRMKVWFFDNTDPDGMDRVLRQIGDRLGETLSVVISKSGGTPETRNGMLVAKAAYEKAGLKFARHAVAVTGEDSQLDRVARSEGWLLRLPMWDWVGGRTSETAAVGLLPAALQGLDVQQMLAGAAAMDQATRHRLTHQNPAALLALMWHQATRGRGEKDMVVLPYKDRLLLFSRYLQQLVMESLGKQLDLDGRRVEQGIAVYGNKGSTDQHAYVQQLREGVNNFFAVFIQVDEDGGSPMEVEPQVTSGDYLHGFWLGTRQALHENGRGSITLSISRVDAFRVGALIALFERAVGLYATLVNINAYHQPGVEAGKKAAAGVLDLQKKLLAALPAAPAGAEEIARLAGAADQAETAFHILRHLAANGRVKATGSLRDPQVRFSR